MLNKSVICIEILVFLEVNVDADVDDACNGIVYLLLMSPLALVLLLNQFTWWSLLWSNIIDWTEVESMMLNCDEKSNGKSFDENFTSNFVHYFYCLFVCCVNVEIIIDRLAIGRVAWWVCVRNEFVICIRRYAVIGYRITWKHVIVIVISIGDTMLWVSGSIGWVMLLLVLVTLWEG